MLCTLRGMGTIIHGVLLFAWVLLFRKLVATARMGTNIHGVLVIDGYLYSRFYGTSLLLPLSLSGPPSILQDISDTKALLHPDNIDYDCLYEYSIEAANWSIDLPRLDFAVSSLLTSTYMYIHICSLYSVH